MMSIEKFLTSGYESRPKPIEAIDFSGTWTNRLGSEIDLSDSKSGK